MEKIQGKFLYFLGFWCWSFLGKWSSTLKVRENEKEWHHWLASDLLLPFALVISIDSFFLFFFFNLKSVYSVLSLYWWGWKTATQKLIQNLLNSFLIGKRMNRNYPSCVSSEPMFKVITCWVPPAHGHWCWPGWGSNSPRGSNSRNSGIRPPWATAGS